MPFVFSLLGKCFASFGAKLLIAFFTEKMIKHVFFTLAKELAKRTKTDKDDSFIEKLEDSYDNPEQGDV